MPYDQSYGKNQECQNCSNELERKEFIENSLCTKALSNVDRLPVRCVGGWAREKIVRLEKYFYMFATGMKNIFPNRNYIEICSGPGICIDRDNSIEIDGTALAILNDKGYGNISKCIFIDNEPKVVDVLNQRINNLNKSKAEAFVGDYYNDDMITKLIIDNTNQKDALNLVFIDPTDCSVPFSTISAIKGVLKKVDFIINIATKHDFNRNVKNIIMKKHDYSKIKAKYERFLNTDSFFNENIAKFVISGSKKDLLEVRNFFRNKFIEEMNIIGLMHTDFKEVESYYDLLFASASPTGLSFWNKANYIEPDGNYNLFK